MIEFPRDSVNYDAGQIEKKLDKLKGELSKLLPAPSCLKDSPVDDLSAAGDIFCENTRLAAMGSQRIEIACYIEACSSVASVYNVDKVISSGTSMLAFDRKDGLKISEPPLSTCMSDASLPMGALLDSLTAPDRWMCAVGSGHISAPPIALEILDYPYCLGGKIDSRWVAQNDALGCSYHGGIQGITTSQMGICEASYLRMDGGKSLPVALFSEESHRQPRQQPSLLLLEKARDSIILSGIYYSLGNVHSHYGHFLVETIPRLWLLRLLPKPLREQITFLALVPSIPDYQRHILALFGVRSEKIVCIGDQCMRPETLLCPTPAYITHGSCSPAALELFGDLSSCSVKPFSIGETWHQRLFLTRTGHPLRRCHQSEMVDKLANEAGFFVIRPELLDIREQIALVSRAECIYGFEGSAMYSALLSNEVREIGIIAPRDFCLYDDLLISGVKQCNLKILLGEEREADGSWGVCLDLAAEFLNLSDGQ